MNQRVLVVDDEMYICHIVRLVLEDAGYDVLQANSAGEGLKILKDVHPDALTVDLYMPGIKDTEFVHDKKVPLFFADFVYNVFDIGF